MLANKWATVNNIESDQ